VFVKKDDTVENRSMFGKKMWTKACDQARGNYLKVVWAKTAGVWKQNSSVSWHRAGIWGCQPEKFLQLMGKSAFWAISWPKWLEKIHAVVDMRLGKI